MNILILEDEIPAYKKLENYLKNYFGETLNYDWARSNAEAKEYFLTSTYDFILSDIQVLDGTSFDLFDELKPQMPIIFCSAHDEYLFKAFRTNGIAYILKPYTQKEFDSAIDKYQTLFSHGNLKFINQDIIKELKTSLQNQGNDYKKRYVIKHAKGIQLLNVVDICVISASGDFCIATDKLGRKHAISQSLGSILDELNPNKFFRINRSEIINIDYINKIENYFKNRLLISMCSCQDPLLTSSNITSKFRKWLE